MLSPQFVLPLATELVVDLFAGGGGASTGIEQALGRHVDIAVNHDPEAVGLHAINHPQTRHFCEDVFSVPPLAVTEGRPVGLLWLSPDCKHFSKAKGGKPVSKKIRGLAWVGVRWAREVRPRIICLENVEEFQTWGPLGDDGMPCPIRKGQTFARWKAALVALGYRVEHRELRACEYGAPTTRKRLFVIARCDGEPIVWPAKTHGPGLRPFRTAADCIDWSIPVPSIFDRARPLAPATMRRIAHGIRRYVLEAAQPFIVPIAHGGQFGRDNRLGSLSAPLGTVTAKNEFSLCAPTLVQTGYGERPTQTPRALDLHAPLGTCVSGQKHALVAAFLAQHNTGNVGHAATEPVSTIVGKGCTQGLVTSNLIKLRGTSNSAPTDAPLGTVSAQGWHHAEVRAFLVRYFGTDQDPSLREPLATCTTKHRDALVTVRGELYAIADIGLRMLQPRELYRAQGFPESYQIDRWLGRDGVVRPLTKGAQVRMCGNSVCPPLSCAIVAANFSLERVSEAA